MSTTLLNAEILLSKQLGDYWAGTTTSAGNSAKTTLIDTALQAKTDDWVTDNTWDMITLGTNDEEERAVKSFVSESGTIGLVHAHTAAVASSVTYRIHRLFSASEKRIALIHAAKAGFPFIHKDIRDESRTVGNWLRNGDMEIWSQTTYPDNWTKTSITCAENTTAPYYTRGSSSCRITTATGDLAQGNSDVSDLIELAGKSVTFKAQIWCNKASCAKLRIYDGTTTTNSSYHDGDSEFAELSVTATIAASPSEVTFSIRYEDNTGTVYVDDARVTGPTRDKIYIGDLGLAQNYPHQIRQSSVSGINNEPWAILRGYEIGSDGYLYMPNGSQDYRLRIKGIGYLDFYDSGTVGTDWDDTIAIDSPQTEILVAEAAIYLCNQMIVPSDTPATTTRWERALAYWQRELRVRQVQFGMDIPAVMVHWSINR